MLGHCKHSRAAGVIALAAVALLTMMAPTAGAAEKKKSRDVSEHTQAVPKDDKAPLYVGVGEATRPPIGWVEFCVRYKPECDTTPSAARDVVLTPKAWSDMVKVNSWANDNIIPVTDLDHWGVVEQWDYPDDGKGDCEDYVLLKRRMLMQAGWPREALLITIVRDKKGDGHAVLTVKTNKGEFVMDNQESEILSWNKTGYRFVKRQAQTDPNTWVALGEPQKAPLVGQNVPVGFGGAAGMSSAGRNVWHDGVVAVPDKKVKDSGKIGVLE